MRKIALAAAAASMMLVGSASAADMAVKARPAPIPAPVFSWTGCYIGAQVGWAELRDRQALSSPVFDLAVGSTADGVKGGGHAGCNYQANQFVFGIEGDIEGSDISNRYVIGAPFANTTGTVKTDWQGSIRGRVGVAFDRVLLYATGGWAWARVTDTYCTLVGGVCAIGGPGFFDSISSTRNGGTVGVGLEYAFLNNFSARVEYRYTHFQDHTNVLANFLAPPGRSVNRLEENAVRVGVSYRFGGPVVAKY
jgi:outer membrane immunogenic protein